MKIYSLTDVGAKRDMNQDYYFSSSDAVGSLSNLFIVADGMGGHNAGEFASKFAVETMVDFIRNSSQAQPGAVLSDAIGFANNSLQEYACKHSEMHGMGTTVVAATLKGKHLHTANVGDSRLYLIGNEIVQVTKDHSLVQEMVRMGEMDEENARNHPDKNIITRAVGVNKEVQVDLFETDVADGQRILLCSDGLTNMLEDNDLLSVLNAKGRLNEKAEHLIKIANERGGKDNITVIIIEPSSDEVTEC